MYHVLNNISQFLVLNTVFWVTVLGKGFAFENVLNFLPKAPHVTYRKCGNLKKKYIYSIEC